MNQTQKTIIALFARSRDIGFVILLHGKLFRYGVRTIRDKRQGPAFFQQVGKSMLWFLEMISPPGVVVIERVEARQHQHGKLTQAIPHVVEQFVEDVYPLKTLSLAEVKQRLCADKNATHDSLIETVTRRYPHFVPYVKGVTRYKAKYWEKVLIALALALVAKNQLEIENKRGVDE